MPSVTKQIDHKSQVTGSLSTGWLFSELVSKTKGQTN